VARVFLLESDLTPVGEDNKIKIGKGMEGGRERINM
jgi:hypothetical protein